MSCAGMIVLVAIGAMCAGGAEARAELEAADSCGTAGNRSPPPGPVRVAFVPSWSPDGSKIAFIGTAAKTWYAPGSVYVMTSDGRRVRRLTPVGCSGSPSWSPDGRMIAFGSRSGIYVMRADGSARRRIRRRGGAVEWSPDGRQFAFVDDGVIRTMNVDGTDDRVVVASSSLQIVGEPAWSPNGRTLAFSVGHAQDSGRPSYLAAISLATGRARGLTRGVAQGPDWSPDGKRIVFSRRFGFRQPVVGIFVLDLESKRVRGLRSGFQPDWSPDGAKIAFADFGVGVAAELFVMNANGTNVRRLMP